MKEYACWLKLNVGVDGEALGSDLRSGHMTKVVVRAKDPAEAAWLVGKTLTKLVAAHRLGDAKP